MWWIKHQNRGSSMGIGRWVTWNHQRPKPLHIIRYKWKNWTFTLFWYQLVILDAIGETNECFHQYSRKYRRSCREPNSSPHCKPFHSAFRGKRRRPVVPSTKNKENNYIVFVALWTNDWLGINQSINQSITPSINQSINRPINQSIDSSINQSIPCSLSQ